MSGIGHGKTVMIVDDEREFRELLEGILRREGYNVVPAGSGRQAIETLGRAPEAVDLVITDCRMPDGDGFELLSHLRSSGSAAPMPVLIISGALSYDEIEIVAVQQPVAILVKPFKREALFEKISGLLRARR